ncbi:MAG: carboxypeptidase regulatory-like domain-containing protein [Euryarchaeota archaeon]|nr:carboxypeptidase regulatory-like domain-containing protein [Euryarchaeota archaeon]
MLRRDLLAASIVFAGLLSGCVLPDGSALGEWEQQVRFYLEAESTTSGGFLALASDAASTESITVDASPTSGLSTASQTMIGGAAPVSMFALRGTLPRDYFLNLSKPVVGTLFWSSTASSTAESSTLRVDAFVGSARIGGQVVFIDPLYEAGEWVPFHVKFRPEVTRLSSGETVTVKVSRYNGLADFRIGTGGNHQSFLELRFFDSNPLASTLYLDNRTLVSASGGERRVLAVPYVDDGPGPTAAPQADPPGSAPPSGPGPGFVVGAPIAGLALLRKKGRAGFVLLMLLAGAFSGCIREEDTATKANPSSTGEPLPQSTGNASFETREELKASGKGEIEGTVRDELQIPIEGAHISLLGTSLFSTTPRSGLFRFGNLSAASYTIRIDREGYLGLEQFVRVEVGKVTILNVTLARPSAGGGNAKAHVHDMFGDATTKLVQNVEFLPTGFTGLANGEPGKTLNTWVCLSASCGDMLVPIDFHSPVPPGSVQMEVTVTWTGGPKELGLRVMTTGNGSIEQHFAARPSGEPFHVVFFPNEADPGHQETTNWQFWVRIPTGLETFNPLQPPAYSGGKIRVVAVAHKGVVPFEPAHRDFWQGASEIALFSDKKLESFHMPDSTFPAGDLVWRPGKNLFVPPGTIEIRGSFRWTNQFDAPYRWKLLYAPANVPPGMNEWRLVPGTAGTTGTTVTFTLPVKSGETDQFYQFQSYWIFAPDDDPDRDNDVLTSSSSCSCWKDTFWLTATAIKDPSYGD